MKKALVLGASGGIGFALVRELVARGVHAVAFARGREKLETLYGSVSNITIFPGDALNEKQVMNAASDVDVIFHAVSFPYQDWEHTHIPCMDILIRAAEVNNAKIALVDNIYAYGKQSNLVTEEALKEPHTKKGKIRLEMETMLKNSGVPSLIVHMPDLYGPNCGNTILHETIKGVFENRTANYVGNLKLKREFLYTFDGAKAMVELAFRKDTYDQNWNIPSTHPITGDEIIQILRENTGFTKSVRTVTKTMIRLFGLFQPFMKELVEMMYLTEEPVILKGEKYEREIGPLPRTSYREGLKETIDWMRKPDSIRLTQDNNSAIHS